MTTTLDPSTSAPTAASSAFAEVARPTTFTGLLQFYNDPADRDRSFIIDCGHGRQNLTVWLPNEPTYTMPDALAPGSINPWDASLSGREVSACFIGRRWNRDNSDWGNVWLVTLL